jgi:NAD(P)-dependent dehydrogenase (short-subunit alcohol dehydrogenase family)
VRAAAEEVGGEHEVCDVGDREAVGRTAASVLERHPQIALLVNNAGIPGRRSFLRAEPESIEEVLRVNYLGSVWCLRAFLPGLEAAAPSDVINVVSVSGHVAFPPSGPYSAAKHAQLAFSRATAAELAGLGIRVHAVSPGFVETPGFPQRGVLEIPVLGDRLVTDPDRVARHVVRMVGRTRRESVFPRWYRIAPLAQSLLPGLLSRVLSRAGYRRTQSRS